MKQIKNRKNREKPNLSEFCRNALKKTDFVGLHFRHFFRKIASAKMGNFSPRGPHGTSTASQCCVRLIVLDISYDHTCLTVKTPAPAWQDAVYTVASTGEIYTGPVTLNYYGKPHPKHAHGTADLEKWTNSTRRIMQHMTALYDRIVGPRLTVRRVNIAAINLCEEENAPADLPKGVLNDQISFFEQPELYTAEEQQLADREAAEAAAEARERKIQKTTLALQGKYGKTPS